MEDLVQQEQTNDIIFKGKEMTKEALDSIINNSEFSKCINEAAPYRVKIMQDLTPQMKEVQNDFLQTHN